MDFIFNVDLSTVYIILRRDFASPDDETGVTSMPLGAGFYYSADAASHAARQYCLNEAAKALDYLSESACHGLKDGMYWGGCITKEPERDRFEVRVRKLKARGGPWRSSGETSTVGSRDMLVTVEEDEEEEQKGHHRHGSSNGRYSKVVNTQLSRASSTVSSRLTGSRAGRLWDSLTMRGRR